MTHPTNCQECGAPLDEDSLFCNACGACVVELDSSDCLGMLLGNLKLTSKLGEGGMGTVYRAEHSALGTPYAVKVLKPTVSKDKSAAERFRREAVLCSQLRHPNIVFVTDFGFHREIGLYIVMEYLDGAELADILVREGRIPVRRAIQLMRQVAQGMAEAHQQGVIHRDLKPDNIFIVLQGGRELAKVLDFGVARLKESQDSQRLTQVGSVIGTPAYMSPEQVRGSESLTPSCDIYALGVMVYELIVGQPPFVADNHFDLLSAHVRDAPKPLSDHRADLAHTKLDGLVLSMLAKKADNRPPDMGEVAAQLGEALEELCEIGITDALPSSRDTQEAGSGERSGTARTMQMNLSGLVPRISGYDSGTRLSKVLENVPDLHRLPPDLFFLTVWTPLVRDLLDEPTDKEMFTSALRELASIIETFLNMGEDDLEDRHHQLLLQHCLEEFMAVCPRERQLKIVPALQPLSRHHRFPLQALPAWALPRVSGTWKSLRGVLTTDIRDLFGKDRSGEYPVLEDISEIPGLEAVDPDASLLDKLGQDVSMDNIRSLLSHEIRLFRKDQPPGTQGDEKAEEE